jgi:hypothetical protein
MGAHRRVVPEYLICSSAVGCGGDVSRVGLSVFRTDRARLDRLRTGFLQLVCGYEDCVFRRAMNHRLSVHDETSGGFPPPKPTRKPKKR